MAPSKLIDTIFDIYLDFWFLKTAVQGDAVGMPRVPFNFLLKYHDYKLTGWAGGTLFNADIKVNRYGYHQKAHVILRLFPPLILSFEKYLPQMCPFEI